jgi:hypothetical protein
MRETPADRQLLPDFVFVARPGYVITRIAEHDGKDHPVLGGGRDFDKYLWTATGDDTLPLFYFTVNVCLAHLRLRAPNFAQLWDRLFRQLVLNGWPPRNQPTSPQ